MGEETEKQEQAESIVDEIIGANRGALPAEVRIEPSAAEALQRAVEDAMRATRPKPEGVYAPGLGDRLHLINAQALLTRFVSETIVRAPGEGFERSKADVRGLLCEVIRLCAAAMP